MSKWHYFGRTRDHYLRRFQPGFSFENENEEAFFSGNIIWSPRPNDTTLDEPWTTTCSHSQLGLYFLECDSWPHLLLKLPKYTQYSPFMYDSLKQINCYEPDGYIRFEKFQKVEFIDEFYDIISSKWISLSPFSFKYSMTVWTSLSPLPLQQRTMFGLPDKVGHNLSK